MTLEDAFYTLLMGDTDIINIIGSGENARLYPIFLPQNITFPALHFSRVNTDRIYSMSGPSCLASALFQIESYSNKTAEEVKNLSEVVRKVLEGFRGVVGNMNILAIFLESDTSLNSFTEQTNIFRYTQDFEIHYTENPGEAG